MQQTDVTPTLAAPGVQRLPSVSSQGVSIDSITLPTRQRDIECARGTTSLVFFLLSLFTSPARTPLFFAGTTSITSDNPWPSFRFRDYRFYPGGGPCTGKTATRDLEWTEATDSDRCRLTGFGPTRQGRGWIWFGGKRKRARKTHHGAFPFRFGAPWRRKKNETKWKQNKNTGKEKTKEI